MIPRLLILFAALVGLGGCSYEREEREIGHVGAARRDPFLAAERFFANQGYDVSTAARFGTGPGMDGTLITPAQSFVNYGMTEQVLKWVRRGGHLVVFLRGGEAFRNDWSPFSLKDLQETDEEVTRLFAALRVESVTATSAEAEAKGKINDQQVSYKSLAVFSWKDGKMPRLNFHIGDEAKPAAASYDEGRGRVTIIASATPFRNRYLGDADNAWLFSLLVSQHPTDAIWFLQGVRISFFGMLWEHAWMAIIPLLVLIGMWLWRHLPRFGPRREAPEESNRDFAGHLRVLGAFQWRHREVFRLIGPLRDTVLRAATRRGWAPSQGDLAEHLSSLAGVPAARVDAALHNVPREPQHFLTFVQDLQKIATALRA